MKGLTQRQRQILDFIQTYIQKHNFSPSYREIMKHFGFSSTATVAKHIDVLKRKKAVSAEKKGRRSLFPLSSEPPHQESSFIAIPFIGQIESESPINIFQETQTINIPRFLVNNPNQTYVLRAYGQTLKEEVIADGDLMIIEAKDEALAGETILGIINCKTLVKQYYPVGNSVKLLSQSKKEILCKHEDLTILGVLIGLWRLYQ